MESNKPKGQKRRFGVAGIINVFITNAALQALLASNLANVAVATLISQAINTILGYAIYGKLVFGAKGSKTKKACHSLLVANDWNVATQCSWNRTWSQLEY